jgi:predicted GH43/DUF377 family glycosyl hydrolase
MPAVPTFAPTETGLSAPATNVPIATSTAAQDLFRVHKDAPVLAHGDANAWDSKYIDPGAVVWHDGQFHMFYNGMAEWSRAAIGYATSPDGVNWTRASGPLLQADDVPFGGIGVYAGSGLVEPGGTWVLFFHTAASPDTGHGSIGRATASSPAGPWQVDAEPVLAPAGGDAWDAWRVVNPSVVRTDTEYTLFYEGVDAQFGVRRIGRATSPDGRRWTRSPDPVLDASEANVWDAEGVWDPNVVQTPGGMVMLYLSARSTPTYTNGFGIAASGLGFNWARLADRPVLNTRDYANWHEISRGALVYANGTFYLFAFVSTPGNETSNIWLATRSGDLDASALDAGIYGVFEGRTPCSPLLREFMAHPPADCQRLKWLLTLFRDPVTGEPTTYEIKGTATARQGNWRLEESKVNAGATVLRLDSAGSQKSLSLLQADDNVLLFLDEQLNPLVGDAILSYTLSRVGSESQGTGVLHNNLYERTKVLPPQTSLFPSGIFEGMTPCGGGAGLVPITPPNANCEQMIWKLTLHADPDTHVPTRYELDVAYGLPQQNTTGLSGGGTKVTRRGNWRMLEGTPDEPGARVLQLDPEKPEETLFFQQVTHGVLLLLDRGLNLAVGNGGWSYTLNRTQ